MVEGERASDTSMNASRWAMILMTAGSVLVGCGKGEKQDSSTKFDPELSEMKKALAEFNNRKKYTELDPEVLKSIPDDKLVVAILDFMNAAIKEDWKNEDTKVPQLGDGFAAVFFVNRLDAEVNNGGFNQFFFNQGRGAVELAKTGAEFMGMKEVAEIVRKALATADREQAKMAKVKAKGTVDAFMESYKDISFDEADEAFFALKYDLDDEMEKFIRARPELFVGKVE